MKRMTAKRKEWVEAQGLAGMDIYDMSDQFAVKFGLSLIDAENMLARFYKEER
jgi:hypothetical protein